MSDISRLRIPDSSSDVCKFEPRSNQYHTSGDQMRMCVIGIEQITFERNGLSVVWAIKTSVHSSQKQEPQNKNVFPPANQRFRLFAVSETVNAYSEPKSCFDENVSRNKPCLFCETTFRETNTLFCETRKQRFLVFLKSQTTVETVYSRFYRCVRLAQAVQENWGD